jgi:CelD/BcsL family acetyltransferase involved in cellulose biosynthesis
MAMTAEILRFATARPPVASIATPGASLRVEAVVDLAAFTQMKDPWNQLLEESRSDSIFLTWEWLHSWWGRLSGARRLHILTVRRGTELVAIAPLAAMGTNWLGLSTLEFLGTGRVGSDYLDVIIRRGEEEQALQVLTSHLARSGAILDLKQLRTTSSAGRKMVSSLRRSGCLVRSTRAHRCPFIDLRGLSFETYLSSLGSEHRYNFQRRLRRLETKHRLRFECVSSEARRREVLPILFELHRLRWESRGGDGLVGPEIREFHDDVTGLALDRGWLRLFVLWLGGSPGATLYGFRRGSVFSFYQSGFDPRFSRLSVGLVAMGLAIKSAIEEGAHEFDLLHGEEPYKSHWARRSRSLSRAVVFPANPPGRASWGEAAVVEGLRGLKRTARKVWAAGLSRATNGGAHAAPIR